MEKGRRFYIGMILFLSAVLGYVSLSLMSFNNKIQEREYSVQLSTLSAMSRQESLVLEAKLEGYLNTLNSMAEYLREGELHSEKNMTILLNVLDRTEQDFQRLGLADLNGDSLVTNGARLNISDQSYFQNALDKKWTITDIKPSKLTNVQVFIVSVPVYDMDQEVRGVLYGVVETSNFHLYDLSSLYETSQYFQVIDRNGSYILQNDQRTLPVQGSNILESLESADLEMPLEQIREKIQAGETIFTGLTLDGRAYSIYFSPLESHNWYAVTMVDKKTVRDYVWESMANDTYIVMAKIVAAVALLCAVIMYFLTQEKKEAVRRCQQMEFNDEMIRTAIGKSDALILIYDLATQQLRCVNPESFAFSLPPLLEHAPETLYTHLPDQEHAKEQLTAIFSRLEHIQESELFHLSLCKDGENLHYQIQVRSVTGEDGGVLRCVGIVENITEHMKMKNEMELLMQEADTDYLTGLYNRRGGTELISEILKHSDPAAESHAFILLDLDNFKKLNDTLGHQTGDAALKDVADLLKRHFRPYDIICRLAGDEFVVFVRDIPKQVVRKNLDSLLKKLCLTYEENGISITVTVSAGAAIAPVHGMEFDVLYQKADKALYLAKGSGKQMAVIYGGADEKVE